MENLNPQERLKQLINFSNLVKVDPHVPPTRYYRSGLEMIRMANVYLQEGSLENAYVLYLKFMTLFLEKIRKHPDFSTVPNSVKATNQLKLREILPKAEKLKEKLLQQYTDEYDRYQLQLKKIAKAEDERMKTRETKKTIENKDIEPKDASVPSVVAKVPGSIQHISYPDPNLTPTTPRPGFAIGEKPKDRPEVDRKSKPTVEVDRYDTNRLRNVVIPNNVMTLFLQMASKNTMNNVETCGVLTGKLEKNELIITHLILPKQKGTPDSCTTMNEEEIFDYQDQLNLITLGWIHTHPTQTAFLSSVDLHTHCPYQLLMPEAVAIVCAPRYNETGFFVLTPTYGLQFISNCRKTGFHPHPTDPPLFKVADHIKIDKNAPLEVLDLRG